LYRYAYLLTGQRAGAQDLTQDTLLRLLQTGDRLPQISNRMAYARRTMTNIYLNQRRRDRRLRGLLPLLWTDRVEDTEEQVNVRTSLDRLLNELPARQRAAIILRFYYDSSTSEVAASLDCPETTARSLIHRGLRRLRVLSATTFESEESR